VRKSPINAITNPNPVYSHTRTRNSTMNKVFLSSGTAVPYTPKFKIKTIRDVTSFQAA
jgi:hypothetical protein